MSAAALWSLSTLGAFLLVTLLARHPVLARLAVVAAAGGVAWLVSDGGAPALYICAAVVGVLLAAGPARVACFELEDTSPRRQPFWATATAWVLTAAIVADGVWAAWLVWGPGLPGTPWEWITLVMAVLAGGGITRLLLAPALIDFVVGPLVGGSGTVRSAAVADWFIVRTGYGRSMRMHHCVVFSGEPEVWRVSWWRLGTLATRSDRVVTYRVVTGVAGLRYLRRLRVGAPLPGPPLRRPAERRPTGPVARGAALGGGLLVVVAGALAALWWRIDHGGGPSPLMMMGLVVIAVILLVVTISARLLRGRGGPADPRDELPGARDELPDARDGLPGATDGLPDATDGLPGARDELPGRSYEARNGLRIVEASAFTASRVVGGQ